MASERGAFTIYDTAKEKNNPFILRLKEADAMLYENMSKYGRRNIALLTIAPTGTTSLMTQTTSGIEPVFMPFYRRRRKVNPNDNNVVIAHTDEVGDSWEEYNVFHHHFITWLKANNYNVDEVKRFSDEQVNKIVEKSPYYKATSNDVDWLAKVKMQGAVQKWVDHSISVTVNLPESARKELVWDLYIEAWKSGCKGVTVYRDGSRDGVLLTNKKENKDEGVNHTDSPKRPVEIEADIVRFQNNNEKWIAFVGLVNGRPYEIFTGIAEDDALPIPKTIVKGVIIKSRDEHGLKRYDFKYTNKYGFHVTIEGLSYKFNQEFWNYAKLISGVLRHGMPIQNVVNLVSSLHLDSETINTWKNGVERALKQYIPDGTRAKEGIVCENCSSQQLIYQEGCLICQSCGTSKCG
jgi:ribonucleoside-diphosphate reductase alpha chain